ncbi:LAMA3 protein, partial [Polypterus senegalus]
MSNMARRSREEAATVLLAYFLLSPLCPSGFAQIPLNEITGFSLHPPYFNLAEGARISATATCGQDETGRSKLELYCKLVGGPTTGLTSQTIQGQFCDYCNSNDPNAAHPITNAIDGTERWWQSPPLSRGLKYNEVNVTLDLGQIVVSLVNGRPGAKNFSYSPVLREFTKATNIRLRFLRTNTLLGHLISKAQRDPTVTRRDVNVISEALPALHATRGQEFASAENTLWDALVTKIDHYFPDLHHLRYEIEDGTTPNGRMVRLGYDIRQFPGFSWRGYAVMSPVQNEVRITLHVDETNLNLFRLILRFVNTKDETVHGHIQASVIRFHKGPIQNKDIFFPPSLKPAFITVPGNGFADPFALTPGKWIINIKAEGVLLDYLVMLPSNYFEAPILQMKVTEPCTYDATLENSYKHCLMYKHVPIDKFPNIMGTEGLFLSQSGLKIQIESLQPAPHFQEMAYFSGKQAKMHLKPRVPRPGNYVVVLEYANKEETVQNVNVVIENQPQAFTQGRANIYSCKYSFLCRSVVIDAKNRIAVYDISTNAELQLHTSTASFFLNQLTFNTRISNAGQYVVVIHYLQPEHAAFPVEIVVDGGRPWMDKLLTRFTVLQDYILVVSVDNYSPDILSEKPLDLSFDFINNCGENSFYIDFLSSTQFCQDMAKSLVAFNNDGALPCNCDTSGSTSSTCNPQGGQCPCKPNVIGRQCSRCAMGFYSFPVCKPCSCGNRLCDEITGQCICPPQTVKPSCNICQKKTFGYHPLVGCEGCNCSESGIVNLPHADCDRSSGQCKCKPKVTGRQCDRCAPGYFNFPECIPCNCETGGTKPNVCDPHTGQCICKFVDMNFWRLEKLDKEKIPVVFNPASNTVVADVQELPDSIHDLYWVAPAKYLGDRISSYGGFLTYQIKSFGLPSEGMALLEKRPDIQLTGQQMTLIFIDPHNHSPGRLYHGRVQLVEGNFRHATTNSPVSREEMMMVLAGLDGLRIRALYFTESQRLTLGEVGLEDVSPTGSGIAALSVEVCKCPPEVRGDSCQKCAPGYYRDKGLYLGRCVPCSCNGLANECEDGSGKCLNCQRNAAGDKCERCKDGFYGNPIHGTCKVCPCPFTSAANRCAPGYYGDPLAFEGECRLCNCGGNGNSGSCDPLTGECDSCVQTLLSDLERLELQMISIKSSLQNLNASSGAQERLRSLEMRIDATKNELNRYQYDVNSRRVKIDQLNSDTIGLSQDISILKEQIHWTSNDSEKLVEAERLVQEMKQRNFNRQRGLAEKEKEEALKLLNRVKNSLQKQLEQNQKSSKRLSEMLNQYDAKLKDLRDALTEASGAVNNAKDINKANVLLAADTKQSIDELKNEKSKVENQIKVTQDQMKQISDLMRMLDGSLQEYEREAAQLDGAKRELTEKVKKLALKNASSSSNVQYAIEATEAYKNITDAVKAAEEAAKKAEQAANSAMQTVVQQDLEGKAKTLKSNGDQLQTDARNAEAKWKEAVPKLDDIQNRLATAERKKLNLQNELTEAQKNLNLIKRDDIGSTINAAKNMAELANSKVNDVLKELQPIQAEVNEIKEKNGGSPSDPNFNNVLDDVSKSIQNISSTIPSLLEKITQVEERSRELSPSSNITDNVERIKELIRQARDAANKIVVPMMFNGNARVEVHPPSNLEDLKAYTALSVFLQRPLPRGDRRRRQTSDSGNMFVLYLGNKNATKDYIAMALRDNKLFSVYNLGGKEYEIRVDSSVTKTRSDESVQDKISLERIYQNAQLIYTKAFTSTNPDLPLTIQQDGNYQFPLLNLDPKDVVFYVGGYPPEFMPPASISKNFYRGCLELDMLNEQRVSLYHFKEAVDVNLESPCKRYNKGSDQYYFEGTGYAQVNNTVKIGRFEQSIQTSSQNGVLFFLGNENLGIYLRQKDFMIYVAGIINKSNFSMSGEFTEYYVGGIPNSIRKKYQIDTPPLRGCVKGVKTPERSAQFVETVGVSKGCSDDLLDNTLSLSLEDGYVTFKINNKMLRSNQKYADGSWHHLMATRNSLGTTLLIDENDMGGPYQGSPPNIQEPPNPNVYLGGGSFDGCISDVYLRRSTALYSVEDFRNYSKTGDVSLDMCRAEKPPQSIMLKEVWNRTSLRMDKVMFSTEQNNMRLIINGLRVQNGTFPRFSALELQSPIFLGAVPALKENSALEYIPKDSVTGCFRNFKLNGQLMVAPTINHGITPCFEGKSERGAYFAGSSAYAVLDPSFIIGLSFELVFEIRPSGLNGILFYIGSQSGDHLTLYMKNGKVIVQVDNGAGAFNTSVTPLQPLCDGTFHRIAVIKRNNVVQLDVDTERNHTVGPSSSLSTDTKDPLYIGGIPGRVINPKLPVHTSFQGCLQNVKLNSIHKPLSKITEVYGPVSVSGCPVI